MGLFGGKKPEQEAEELFLSGDYDVLMNLIFSKAVQSGKMKKDVALDYLNKIIAARESARAYYLLSLLMIPDKRGLEYAVKARDMEPTNEEYVENLAMYYSEGMRDNSSVLGVYERFWKDTGDIKTGLFVAQAYLSDKNPDRAGSIAQEILQKDPNNKKAAKILKKSGKAAKRTDSEEIPCPNCGTMLSKDATVCYSCGLDLKRWREKQD